MTKEELIKELVELKNERMSDLMKLNAKHDMLVEFIANLNYLIAKASRKDNEDG